MIVQKIKISEKEFAPDIPEGLEYESCTLNPDGETYTITFTPEQLAAMQISPAQGRTQLHRLGMLEAVENAVNKAGGETAIFWEYAVTWELHSKVLNQFAEDLQIDLKEFFNEARKIAI